MPTFTVKSRPIAAWLEQHGHQILSFEYRGGQTWFKFDVAAIDDYEQIQERLADLSERPGGRG